MRTIIQRVKSASVTTQNEQVGAIKEGLCVLVGVEDTDTADSLQWMMQKIMHMRVFEDENGKMNKSLMDIGGEILLVSQFTLLADCVKGRRPSLTKAGDPKRAKELFDDFVGLFKARGIAVETGVFGADMVVQIENNGPATFILQTPSNNLNNLTNLNKGS